MKHVFRGAVLAAGIVLGLALAAPAFAEAQASSQDAAKLTQQEQRIFAQLKDNNPWYDPSTGGGGGGGGGGNGGGGIGSSAGNGAVVPEPGTIALLGLGLGALGVARRRQKAQQENS